MKKRISKKIFHFSHLIIEFKNENWKKELFLNLFWFKTNFKKQKSKFSNPFFDFKSSLISQFWLWNWKMKNGRLSKFVLFWNQKTNYNLVHVFLMFLISQCQYRNENQIFISNFVLQFMKNMKWHFRCTDFSCFKFKKPLLIQEERLKPLYFSKLSYEYFFQKILLDNSFHILYKPNQTILLVYKNVESHCLYVFIMTVCFYH